MNIRQAITEVLREQGLTHSDYVRYGDAVANDVERNGHTTLSRAIRYHVPGTYLHHALRLVPAIEAKMAGAPASTPVDVPASDVDGFDRQRAADIIREMLTNHGERHYSDDEVDALLVLADLEEPAPEPEPESAAEGASFQGEQVGQVLEALRLLTSQVSGLLDFARSNGYRG